MHIGLVLPGFSAHAGDWCIPALRHLVGHLSELDEVRVLALRYPYHAGDYQLFGAGVTALGGGQCQGWRNAGLWQQGVRWLVRQHRRQPFDVLHAFWANETGALTAITARILGIPSVVSLAGGELVALHDIGYGGQLAWRERLKVRLGLRLAHTVTAGSQSLLRRAAPWVQGRPTGQVRRIPLGVDLDMFRGRPPAARMDPPRLLHVASLTPVKDQTTLLRAAARLRHRDVPFRLDIVGDGSLAPDLRRLAHRCGLADVVSFRGPIPHHELPAIYSASSLFVLSSRFEAQSMVALEAAACRLPVVSTDVGVVPELRAAAVVVPIGENAALAEALAELLGDGNRCTAMARAARYRVETEFSLERCVTRFRGLYTSLIEAGSQRK